MNHLDAYDLKLKMWHEAKHKCTVCGKELIAVTSAQLAHRIPKYRKYLATFGPKIIHHPFNMRITCDKCNSKVLLSFASHPVEARELIERIKEDLNGMD